MKKNAKRKEIYAIGSDKTRYGSQVNTPYLVASERYYVQKALRKDFIAAHKIFNQISITSPYKFFASKLLFI